MKRFLLVFVIVIISLNAFAEIHNSLPDNDLWKEDFLRPKSPLQAQMFNQIIDVATELYKPVAAERGETLTIVKNWDDPKVNASCMRSGKEVEINMYGGLARRPEITMEGFVLVLCHELGHAYGGIPYIREYSQMSAEGQADYYSAKSCAANVLWKVPQLGFQVAPTPYMMTACGLGFTNDETRQLCLRVLVGGQSLGNLLAILSNDPKPSYETPDTNVVHTTTLSYPDTTQCRLDTYFAGATGKDRPKCWFAN